MARDRLSDKAQFDLYRFPKMDNAELSTNRYPLMKDSGVEWLGRIPAGWKIKKLKYLVNLNEEALPETTNKSFPIKYVDISNVKAGVGIL